MTERYRPTPADYKMIFEDNKVGNAIFEDLVRQFTKPAVTRGGIDAVIETYQRLGMRTVIDHIALQINRAHDVPDVQPQENNDADTQERHVERGS